MSTAQRVREPVGAPEKEKSDWTESVLKAFSLGVGRLADVQKKSIDFAVQQNTEMSELWKKAMQKVPGAPGLFLLELQANGLERYADMQKATIDMAVEQSRAFTDLARERTATATKVNEEVDTFAKKSMERVVAMQKKALDQSAAQAREVVESSTRQFGKDSPVEAAADSMQRGVDAIVDAQKELLDMAIR